MREQDNTNSNDKVHQIPVHEYNIKRLDAFLSVVFPETLPEGANIIANVKELGDTFTKNRHIDSVLDELERKKRPAALYFGTAITVLDERGAVRNGKKVFSALCVVVLDDIGTKIPLDALPPALKPTYVIESSPGNYQWGFVLDTPITNLSEAQLLVRLVYTSGKTDSGGATATKLVRLPDGVNGKAGPHELFPVVLHSMDGPKYTPQQLLDALEITGDWEQMRVDCEHSLRVHAAGRFGATAWTPAHLQTVDGVVDPVAEWLLESGMVYDEEDEWLEIRCPNSHLHSDGKTSAYYSPLGWGEGPYRNMRGFHCFHDHCSAYKSPQFLQWVWEETGMGMAVSEHPLLMEASSRWVIDTERQRARDVKVPGLRDREYPLESLTNLTKGGRVQRINPTNGKLHYVPAYMIWKENPATVAVHGTTFKPSCDLPLVEDTHGNLQHNLFQPPMYKDHTPDMALVQPFLDHLRYLVPDEDDHTYVTEWLACKVQHRTFRGAAIIMVATTEGIGRSMFGDMLGKMFLPSNVESINFNRLTSGDTYNAWIENLILIVEETLAVDDGAKAWKVYDHLKELVDPRTSQVRVNPKYGAQHMSEVATSFLLFSNHIDALQLPEGARRFFATINPTERQEPAYYGKLFNYISGDVWMSHVWNYFRRLPVDLVKMSGPPPVNAAIQQMRDASATPMDVIFHALSKRYSGYIPVDLWKQATEVQFRSLLPESALVARRMWRTKTASGEHRLQIKVDRHKRYANAVLNQPKDAKAAREQMRIDTMTDVMEYLSDELQKAGY